MHLDTGKYKNKNFSQETEFLEVLEQIVVGIGYGERVTVLHISVYNVCRIKKPFRVNFKVTTYNFSS